MIAGHREAREALEASLPPVTLLLGPDHVGKKTLASYLMGLHAPERSDRLWVPWLSIPAAEQLQNFVMTAPTGSCRVVVIVLARASSAALNRILKTLEEPPPTARFILVGRREPLATIRSRASTWVCGLLADKDVAAVLVDQGTDPATAYEQARVGAGQVRVAMGSSAKARGNALMAIKATLTQDSTVLAIALKSWSAEDSVMLTRWCEEKISGQWKVFGPADTTAGRQFAHRLYAALAMNPGARPRLAAAAALEAASGTER